MTINTKNDAGFLAELSSLLRKTKQKQSLGNVVGEPKGGYSSQPVHDVSTAAESAMGLLTHLVDLERRVRLAEKRGELKSVTDIGQIVRAARKRQGLTVEGLADLAEVGVGTIHKVEQGTMQVQMPKLVQITQALGLELLVSSR